MDLFTEIRGRQPDFDAVFGGGSSSSVRLHGSNLGDILQPTAVGAHASLSAGTHTRDTRLTTDVESSLAKAAENLSEFFGGG